MNETNQTTSQDKPVDQIFLVLHDVLYRFASLNLAIGDIVLTSRSFSFVRYHDFQYAGPLGTAGGALIGGLAGGIAASMSEKRKLDVARNFAKECRSKLYGFPLGERESLYPKSIVRAPAAVADLRASGKSQISVTMRGGERFEFIVGPMSDEIQAVINSWPASHGLYDLSSDPEGFFVGGDASPKDLLRQAAGGDSKAAARIYRLAKDTKYAFALYSEIKAINLPERQELSTSFADAPEEFRQSLIAAAKKESSVGAEAIKAVSMVAVLSVGIGIWGALTFSIDFLYFLGLTLLMVGFLIVPNVKKVRCAKEIMNLLE